MVRLVHLLMSTMILDMITSGTAVTRLPKACDLKKASSVYTKTSSLHKRQARLRRLGTNTKMQPALDQLLVVPREYFNQPGQKYNVKKSVAGYNPLAENQIGPSSVQTRPMVNLDFNDRDFEKYRDKIQRQGLQGHPSIDEWPRQYESLPNNERLLSSPVQAKNIDNALINAVSKMTPEAQNALIEMLLKTIISKGYSKSYSKPQSPNFQSGESNLQPISLPDLYAFLNRKIYVQKTRHAPSINGNFASKSDHCCNNGPGRSKGRTHMRCRHPTRIPFRDCYSPQMPRFYDFQSPMRECNQQPPKSLELQQQQPITFTPDDVDNKVVNLTQIFDVRPRMLVVNSNLPFRANLPGGGRMNLKRGPECRWRRLKTENKLSNGDAYVDLGNEESSDEKQCH